ncbi:MAG: family 10 glycosylhydrolase, partial [Acutalibacteraceae bacterium]
WRNNNVNKLIATTYEIIKNTNPNVEFGISPQGNIDNNKNLYADVKSWCEISGYVDYICPQIYFSLDNPALNFEDCLASWQNLNFAENVKLYVGLAGYKAGTNKDKGTWLDNDDILKNEYEITKDKNIDGIMLYSFEALENKTAKKELLNLKKVLN